MNTINKFFKHLHTINIHRRTVRRLCFKCGLYWQGIIHDLSKYSPSEFIPGVKYFTGYCSPHVAERKSLGYSNAWMHHKGRNKHHAEYWRDNTGDTERNIEMPLNYLAEMICDRIGACKVYLKSKYTPKAPLEYYKSHYDENQFHPMTRDKLEYYLTVLSNFGEDELFNQLKMDIKHFKKFGKY